MMTDVALLCVADDSSAAVANALCREFRDIPILIEQREPRTRFLKRRIRRLGFMTVANQIAFAALMPVLRWRSRNRIAEIVAAGGLDLDRACLDRAARVTSVNQEEAIAWLRRHRPRVVVVNGTRIIAPRVLEASDAQFINTHCGITPKYRGAHGGYWALYNGDREHCGVTIHRVDPGIDTGGILAQALIDPTPRDTITTYPYLQLSAALPRLIDAVRDSLAGKADASACDGPSGLWYHPTLVQYLAAGLLRRVW